MAALLWALYFRLRKLEFFLWWACAWTAFGAYLATAAVSLVLGPTWTMQKASAIFCMLLAGYMESVFLAFGGLSWQTPRKPTGAWFWGGLSLAVAAAVVSFAMGYLLRYDPQGSMAIRNLPRTAALAASLLFCCAVFLRQSRRTRSWAAAITGVFCFSYAIDQVLYSFTFADFLSRRLGVPFAASLARLANVEMLFHSRIFLLDILNTWGICFGMILLLVERYQRKEKELEESQRVGVGLAVDNVALQREIKLRQSVEESLRESESRYRDLVEHSEDLLGTHDLNGKILSINPAPARRLGYEVEELLHVTVQQLLTPRFRDRFPDFVARVLERGYDKGRMIVVTRAGEERIWEYHSTLRSEGVPEPVIRGMAHDITERVRTEQALRESEAKFRQVTETVACAIWILQDDHLVYLNRETELITGYSRKEILAMGAWELVQADLRPLLQERARAGKKCGQGLSRYQYKIRTKSGEERWLELTDSVMQYEGRPAILAAAFDITATKRAEQELREHTMYLESLISNNPLGIVIKDESHRVRFCNPAFERMFGYTQSEIQGQDLDDILAPHQHEEAARLSRSVQAGGVVHSTAQRCRKDRTLLDVELHGVRVFSGPTFVGAFAIYQDITERRRSEERMQVLRSRLARAREEERARIARDLHDDTGQRLALLSIELEQLKQTSIEQKSSLSKQLEALLKTASEITSDVHNVSRRLHPSQVELLGLVTALSNFFKEFSSRNGMEIQFVHSGLHVRPPQDVALCMFRVAQEAIRNVQKHSGCARALVDLDEVGGTLCLRVSDQGAGFDPNAAEANQGLGLLSMEERLNSMGGELFVHSQPGGGTCVEASIPLTQTMPAAQAQSAKV